MRALVAVVGTPLAVVAGRLRLAWPVALAALALASAGCGEPPMEITVQSYNDSAETVEVRFRATSDDGSVLTELTNQAPPGYAVLGKVTGSSATYHLEAWAMGERAELTIQDPVSGTVCNVYVANPTPVRIGCTP